MAKGQKFKSSPTVPPTQSSSPMPWRGRGQDQLLSGHGAHTLPLSPWSPPRAPIHREWGVRAPCHQRSAGTGAKWATVCWMQTETPIGGDFRMTSGPRCVPQACRCHATKDLRERKSPGPRPPNLHETPEMGRCSEAQTPALPCSRKTHQPRPGGNKQE